MINSKKGIKNKRMGGGTIDKKDLPTEPPVWGAGREEI